MSLNDRMTRPSAGAGPLIAGMVLLALGVLGVILYAVGAPDQAGTATPLGAMRGVLVIAAALCMGLGAALTVVGIIKRRKRG